MNKLITVFALLIIAISFCKAEVLCHSNSDCLYGGECSYIGRTKMCHKHKECFGKKGDCWTGFHCTPTGYPKLCISNKCTADSQCGQGICRHGICMIQKKIMLDEESIFMEEENNSVYNRNYLLLCFAVGAILGVALSMMFKRKQMAKVNRYDVEVEISPVLEN